MALSTHLPCRRQKQHDTEQKRCFVLVFFHIYKTAFGFHCVFEKQDCPFFHKYKQLIALDMEDAVFSGTQMSDDQLWGAIIELPSFWQKGGCQNLLDGLPGMSKPASNCQNSLQHAVS